MPLSTAASLLILSGVFTLFILPALVMAVEGAGGRTDDGDPDRSRGPPSVAHATELPPVHAAGDGPGQPVTRMGVKRLQYSG